MMNEQEIREMLKHRADAISATPSHIRPAVRAARRRLALTVGLALVSIGVLAAGAVVGATRLTTAPPAVPAGQPPASERPPMTQETSSGPFFLDLRTGEKTPLPRAILRSFGPDVGGGRWPGQFAASPDGSQLAYVVTIGGRPQIFIAGIDGTGVRQITDETTGAISPAWSPDSTSIAFHEGTTSNILVLELDTGQITRVADEPSILRDGLQFTPDGSSILFTGGPPNVALELRTVPVNGGRSTLLFDPHARGFGGTAGGSLSPDGSLVTFMGDRIGGGGALRFVTNADGTDWRHIGSCISNPAGTWSPDGSRIVCGPNGPPPGIRIIDIATGDVTTVAQGRVAIWVDDHTLLVEAR